MSYRMNISIPEELKARMDAVKANWSAVAAQAFEEFLSSKPDFVICDFCTKSPGLCDACISNSRLIGRLKLELESYPKMLEHERELFLNNCRYSMYWIQDQINATPPYETIVRDIASRLSFKVSEVEIRSAIKFLGELA